MNSITTHSKIIPFNDSEPRSTYYRFSLDDLHPFDRMKCVLEQWFFYSYLKETTTSTSTIPSFKDSLDLYTSELPGTIPGIHGALEEMYQLGIRLIQQLQNEQYTSVSYMDAYVIFNQPPMDKNELFQIVYDSRLYTSSMTQVFLVEWFATIGKMYEFEDYPEGVIHSAAFYVPNAEVVQNYNPEVAKEENQDYSVCVNLEARPIVSFKLKPMMENIPGVFGILDRCTFTTGTPLRIDDIIGYLASFSIDHDRYIMKFMDPQAPRSVVDVCYDLVTGSSFTQNNAGVLVDHGIFIQLMQRYVTEHQLLPCQDSELFGALIEKLGADPKVVNYFVQPDEAVTGAEAFAFRRSEYASLFAAKFFPGMEADDEEAPEDQPDDEEEPGDDQEDDQEQQTSPEVEDTVTGTEEDEPTQEPMDPESDTAEEPSEKPEIDPDKMLLELVQPNETLADYIYREMVSRRITAILQNPPESARPNDLLMLKRWKSRWLYLTSIACLRDFLSRVSIRLSEV